MATMDTAIAVTRLSNISCTHLLWNRVLALLFEAWCLFLLKFSSKSELRLLEHDFAEPARLNFERRTATVSLAFSRSSTRWPRWPVILLSSRTAPRFSESKQSALFAILGDLWRLSESWVLWVTKWLCLAFLWLVENLSHWVTWSDTALRA